MIIGARFDPTTQGSTSVLTALRIPNYNPLWGLMRVLIQNPTGVNVDVHWDNGYVLHSAAHSRRFVEVRTESDTIYWQVVSYVGSYSNSTPPITVELFYPDESPPIIYSDMTPPLLPQGQIAEIDWTTSTADQVINIANKANQIIVIDGYDLYLTPHATNFVTLEVIFNQVNVPGGGFQYQLNVPPGASPLNVIDHNTFPNRGLQQQGPGLNIIITIHNNVALALAGRNMFLVKYHFEINY